jgi:hypothetical protein
VKTIFDEEGLPCTYDAISERNKRPDFLFPSAGRYNDPDWPPNRLRMLAVKTTCKDRWRQVIDEAARIPEKHLLTLQQGVSVSQFRQMEASGICLVAPRQLHAAFPEAIRPSLLTLAAFIKEVKAVCTS